MGQDVDVPAFNRRPVGAGFHRFDRRLAVHYNQPDAEPFGATGQGRDLLRGHVGQLDAGDKGQTKTSQTLTVKAHQLRSYLLQIGASNVIGDGQRRIAQGFGPAQHLAGEQDAIAEKGMGV